MKKTVVFNTKVDGRGRFTISKIIREKLNLAKGCDAHFVRNGSDVTIEFRNPRQRRKSETL